MATTSFFFSNPTFQSQGTAAWSLPLGDADNYWGFSVRPVQANDTVVVERVSAHQDNNLNNSTTVVVTLTPGVGTGGLLRFTAIRVKP